MNVTFKNNATLFIHSAELSIHSENSFTLRGLLSTSSEVDQVFGGGLLLLKCSYILMQPLLLTQDPLVFGFCPKLAFRIALKNLISLQEQPYPVPQSRKDGPCVSDFLVSILVTYFRSSEIIAREIKEIFFQK